MGQWEVGKIPRYPHIPWHNFVLASDIIWNQMLCDY